MIVRPATAADAAAICAFWNPQIRETAVTFSPEERSPDTLGRLIETRQAEGRAFFVAEEQTEILGFATYFQFRGGPGYGRTMEHTVILSPAAWGRGAGRALMAAVEDHARDRGIHSMIAGVSSENPAGIAFHARLGYAEIARLPEVGWKFGRWMDLVVMQKLL